MLKYRLIFGTLMTILFTAIVVYDGYLDGSLTGSVADESAIQGSLLAVLIALLIIAAVIELSKLAANKGLRIFTPVVIVSSILISTSWYLTQFIELDQQTALSCILAFSFLAVMLYQYLHFGTSGVLVNCGVNCFVILYTGLLSGFVLAIRIEYGVWQLLMFIFVVKAADIGAYTIGMLFGKHKFAPKISPGKTWEGMVGAVIFAVIVSVLFSAYCDIIDISVQAAIVFGILFAFIGQLGDLTESLIKRDAQQKDSSDKVPGFGGILDVIDSPLASAVFAYLFFMVALN